MKEQEGGRRKTIERISGFVFLGRRCSMNFWVCVIREKHFNFLTNT